MKHIAGLVCFDMDGTLIDCEPLVEMAKEKGVFEEVKAITEKAMNGEMDFSVAVEKRVEMLKGLPCRRLEALAEEMPIMPGARELVSFLKEKGFVTGILTGGFGIVAKKVSEKLGGDFYIANDVEIKSGMLTGKIALRITDNKGEIIECLKKTYNPPITIAVGDGFTDIPMLKAADIGIAFMPKPAVKETILVVIEEKNLMKVADIIKKRNYTIIVDSSVHESAGRLLRMLGEVEVTDTGNMSERQMKEAEILVIRTATKVDKKFMDKAENLRILASATTGLNHIDAAYAQEKGIEVVSAQGENADSVADYVFRMIFHATDDVLYTSALLKNGKNFSEIKKSNERHELCSKSLGIIGYGRIGKKVAERAAAFGMEVKAHDPYAPEARNTLEEALGCDIVTLHVNLTGETRDMIDACAISKMQRNSVLINTSRGEVVDERSLAQALKERRIRMAILDVFQNDGKYSVLYELENTIVTPHIAGNTAEATERAAKRIFKEILGKILKMEGTA
ncbi:MAG: phosphoserine phosphatase SerB [Candidatus Aenigmarchaeota archaeon]|nr:phosphoserine phosphatase SerB [Candidatus Aenigmarchaeota archaeon]